MVSLDNQLNYNGPSKPGDMYTWNGTPGAATAEIWFLFIVLNDRQELAVSNKGNIHFLKPGTWANNPYWQRIVRK